MAEKSVAILRNGILSWKKTETFTLTMIFTRLKKFQENQTKILESVVNLMQLDFYIYLKQEGGNK